MSTPLCKEQIVFRLLDVFTNSKSILRFDLISTDDCGDSLRGGTVASIDGILAAEATALSCACGYRIRLNVGFAAKYLILN